MAKTGLKISTGLAVVAFGALAFFGIKSAIKDASGNLKVIPLNGRVHGLVNGFFLRIIFNLRIVNNSQLRLTINNINQRVNIKTADGNYKEIAYVPNVIPSFTLLAAQSFDREFTVDVNLLALAGPLLSMLRGKKMTVKTTTDFYVLTLLQRIDNSFDIQVPETVSKVVENLIPNALKGNSTVMYA
jgi:hypothetical protein